MLTFLKSKKGRVGDGTVGTLSPEGTLSIKKFTMPTVDGEMDIVDILHFARPHNGLDEEMNQWKLDNAENINRGLLKIVKAKEFGIPTFYGTLWAKKITADGEEIDYGIVSLRVVTDTGVGFIVDAFQNLVELENMKFHGIGTGTVAEAAADSALGTELTTEYNPNSTRATGSTTETSANIYRTVGTNTLDSGTPAVTEHGVLSQAATGGGVLLDRSKFAAINLVGANGDSLQTTYDLTLTSGS